VATEGRLLPVPANGCKEGTAVQYIFGDYVLDTQCYELHHAGKPVSLRPKVLEVLAYLLAHRQRVVPKDELLERL
jgi:DNA-binding winged helix-turn-helix (wHTH) protein